MSRDPRLARRALGAGFAEKPLASAVTTGTPSRRAFLDRLHRRVGGRDDVGVVRHLGQRGERRPGALAQHLVAPRIDRIDRARRSPPAADTCSGRPAVLVASLDCADDRDRLRREQRPAHSGFGHSAASDAFGFGGRWSKRRSNTCSAMRFFSISIEPPAIIQPRHAPHAIFDQRCLAVARCRP